MCWTYKPKGVRKTGDIMVGDVAVAKNLTNKEYVKFMDDAKQAAKNKYKNLPEDEGLAKYLNDLVEARTITSLITDDVILHANKGDFALPVNPKQSILPGKMKSGGHGQENIKYLDDIGRKYKVEHTYNNGVRIGSVEKHKHKIKKLVEGEIITGQSWFPINWSKVKIKQAFEYVIQNNLNNFKQLQNGPPPIFDIYEGVRVGVIKTEGKPATIFPDNAKQPFNNSNELEINPFNN